MPTRLRPVDLAAGRGLAQIALETMANDNIQPVRSVVAAAAVGRPASAPVSVAS
jgi:hypothetical protein